MNIIVRQDGDQWGAFHNDKRIAYSKCRSCVVNAVISVTKKSTKYHRLIVMGEEDSITAIFNIGANAGKSV